MLVITRIRPVGDQSRDKRRPADREKGKKAEPFHAVLARLTQPSRRT